MKDLIKRRAYLSTLALSGVVAGCIGEDTDTDTLNQNTSSSTTQTDPQSPAPTEHVEPTGIEESTGTAEPTETEAEESTDTQSTSGQPKIREVEDNFGNTFSFDRDASDSVQVDEEIVVSDATEVELCVTEVANETNNEVSYSYWFGSSQSAHPDNTAGDARIEENCWSWDMQRDDYSSDWVFSIWIRNDDEIYYQNNSVESDFRVTIHYSNLTLEGESTDCVSGPSQPKIREVQDNFGHTFFFDGDASDSVLVDDEVVVSDATEVELCVTELEKQESDTVGYSYWFGSSQSEHPDNTPGDARRDSDCHTWDMQREDYSSRWRFSIWVRNEDEIYYQNNAVESDYRVVIHYDNLILEE